MFGFDLRIFLTVLGQRCCRFAQSRSKTTTCFVNSLLSGSFLINLKKKRIWTRCFVCSPRCAFRKEPRRIASTLSTSRSSVFHFKSSVFFSLRKKNDWILQKKKVGLYSTVPGLEPRIAWSVVRRLIHWATRPTTTSKFGKGVLFGVGDQLGRQNGHFVWADFLDGVKPRSNWSPELVKSQGKSQHSKTKQILTQGWVSVKRENCRSASWQDLVTMASVNFLRGAWRDHCFPEPFSWFLHETGLESLKITSARCFLLKCQRKVSKKAKEHHRFRGVLGRWRTAAIDRTTFHACQRCRKTAVFAVFFSALGCHLARKSLSWPAMSLSNKKQEFEQRKRIKLFDDFWVRAYRFDFAPRRRPRASSI